MLLRNRRVPVSLTSLSLCGCFAATALVGCSSSSSATNDGGTDSAIAETAPVDAAADVVVETGPTLPPVIATSVTGSTTQIPPTLTCAGTDAGTSETGADGGAATVPVSIALNSFNESGTYLPNTSFDVFFSNTFGGSASAVPDLAGPMTDSTGMVTISLPAGTRVAYRVPGTATLFPYYELDSLVPSAAGGSLAWYGMKQSVYNELAAAISGSSDYTLAAGVGVVPVRVADCNHDYIRNVEVDIVDASGNPLTYAAHCNTTDFCRVYLGDNGLPDTTRTYTSGQGLAVFANVSPTGTGAPYSIVGKGVATAGGAVQTLFTRPLELVPQTITVEYLHP